MRVKIWIALAVGLVALVLASTPAAAQASLDANCPGPPETFVAIVDSGNERWAQTFTAQSGGVLTSAQATVQKGPGADWLMQVAAVDGAGTPTNALLASEAIPDSSVPNGSPTTVSANFASPAAVTAGQQYALIVSRPNFGVTLAIRQGDDCAGQLFASEDMGPFLPFAGDDMVFAVFVEPDCDGDGLGDETQDPTLLGGDCPIRGRTLTLDASKNKAKKGKRVTLFGQLNELVRAGECEAVQTVDLQRKRPSQSSYTTFAQLQTDAQGTFSTTVKVRKTFQYQAQVPAAGGCGGQVSNTEKVKVKKPK
jgi:hypothetical protein